MSYAILRIEKCKSLASVGSRAAHNLRQCAAAAPHADPAKKSRNAVLVGPKGAASDVTEAVRARLATVPKIRSNAVLAVEMVLTTSPEFFTDKTRTQDERNRWLRESMAWVNDTFGADNVVSAVLHMDEKTPHIQLMLVPIHEGKLRAAHWFDGPAKLGKLQDSYAKRLEPLRLRRGVKGSKASHTTLKDWYRLVGQITRAVAKQAKAAKPPTLPKRGLLGQVSAADWAQLQADLERYGQEGARLRAESLAGRMLAQSGIGQELAERQAQAEADLKKTQAEVAKGGRLLIQARAEYNDLHAKSAKLRTDIEAGTAMRDQLADEVSKLQAERAALSPKAPQPSRPRPKG
jgi:hypothetical protein